MSLSKVFSIAGSAMSAQSARLNVGASNLANAGSVGSSPDTTYRTRYAVFASTPNPFDNSGLAGVSVTDIVQSTAPLEAQYQPEHPEADENGYIYISDVRVAEEMVNMLSASRSYQNSVEMINTTKDLLLQTLSLGR